MNINKLIEEKVKEAQLAKAVELEVRVQKLLSDKLFIESQRKLTSMRTEINYLKIAMATLNKLPPFITSDGRKFNLNVFSVPFFGLGLGELIGIIVGSRGAFTDDLQLQYESIIGVPFIELQQAVVALGSPAYYKDGVVYEAIEGNYYELVEILKSLALKLEIYDSPIELSKEKYELWFAKEQLKANRKLAEFNKASKLLDTDSKFTIED